MRHTLTPTLLAALLLATTAATAAHAASRDEESKACRGDALHFCASEIPNEQKITACMKAHYQELSPACKTMFRKPPAAHGKGASDASAQ